ncbi:ATP-binding protein [Burkholderia sp. KCJ3K979]|uniref:NACHT domain-containing protein n=1 Tax=Burkholderia sp. KCJ3K979 TaxID=2759149 RepID=UPI00192A0387|nr:ATP-binding protein [Burkholderia sp. KCJ3K979]MBL3962229.1 ATP-binding protein [Burkholderia sp. KCJ3K979]
MIERIFQNIPEGKITDADKQPFLTSLGWSRGLSWNDLLQSWRVLLISEAGAGKTYECRAQAQHLSAAGEPTFFVELANLATSELRTLLDDEEENRLNTWLSSQSDVATFFLDSIDELQLSLGSFERALKRFKKGIAGNLGRARIVITTRPVAFDSDLVRSLLPIPPTSTAKPSEDEFAMIAMRVEQKNNRAEKAPEWRTVALMPLSDAQIVKFACDQGVTNPDILLEDLRRRNAQEFARRPQDLIELCCDWREHKRIRTHYDQVAANVRIKLQPRDDRPEPAELSVEKAMVGASRLALAMLMTRRLTVRHNAASDDIHNEAALNPSIILPDWSPSERKALLERPLFGFASYGRVRFHHRSVAEYLAAQRLRELREAGMPLRALKRLLFAETRGKVIVRPSKRPVAGWLALGDDAIFEILRDNDPAVLLNEGDPETLTPMQRIQALRAYVERYGKGGWRGRQVPHIQIHRFASPELASEVTQIWSQGVENPDVRLTLLYLIEAGRLVQCADVAYRCACDPNADSTERIIALDAMVALEEPRLPEIAHAVANDVETWPDKIARAAIVRLFPRDISIDQLCKTLARLTQGKRDINDLSPQLSRLIENAQLNQSQLVSLRDGLVELVSDGLSWHKEWPHLISNRENLSDVLASVCVRGIGTNKDEQWLDACVLSTRLHDQAHSSDESHKALLNHLNLFEAQDNEKLFWATDKLIQSLRVITDPWNRLVEIIYHDSSVRLTVARDLPWIKMTLANIERSTADRALVLQAALRLSPDEGQWQHHLSELEQLVSDQTELLDVIAERRKLPKNNKELERMEARSIERKRQRDRTAAKNRASWILFWREVSQNPESAFSDERSWNTAWNLWRAMSRDGAAGQESGWNRRLIEEHFGKETADRLRRILMNIWRAESPTCASERPADQRNTYLVRWQLGLAAIYAEAEDPGWARQLTEEEARLAARFALVEINGLPAWLDSLIDAHSHAVDTIIGQELTWELSPKAKGAQSLLLQSISYAQSSRLYLPRLMSWLEERGDCLTDDHESTAAVQRLRQVIGVILQRGDEKMRMQLFSIARQRLQNDLPIQFNFVWLATVIRIDPEIGVAELENRLRTIEPGPHSEAVTWFSVLFGDRIDSISLRDEVFTPSLLLRLLRLSYHHVRPNDDATHEGSYSPDVRDHAERARNEIVGALLDAKGEDGWAAKLEMSNDPLCAHFRDRIISVAEEHWAQEIDSVAFNDMQAISLDKTGEAPASTNEAMFAVLKDRLSDLDDLLLRDTSPREAWAGISDEKVMRREIARELSYAANGIYKIDQEAVTADEKETDIRLRSTTSDHEAIIELKLGDGRSAKDLRDTIYNQLVKKYMAPENSRSGCLLITLAKNRKWENPDNGQRIDLDELMLLLQAEIERVQEMMANAVLLSIHLLDLRTRLPVENR